MLFRPLSLLCIAAVLASCSVHRQAEPEIVYEFNETGVLARNETGMSPGVWYLRHGGADDESFFIRLSFSDDTICVQNAEEGSCPRSLFTTGLHVTVRGDKAADGHIEVRRMETDTVALLTETFEHDAWSMQYPASWNVKEASELSAPAYTVRGTAFNAPELPTTLYQGTMHIAPQAACPRLDNTTEVRAGSGTYKYAAWQSTAAGTRYEGETYMKRHDDGSCAVVTFYARSCNLGMECERNKTTPYDKETLFATLRRMLETLQWKNLNIPLQSVDPTAA